MESEQSLELEREEEGKMVAEVGEAAEEIMVAKLERMMGPSDLPPMEDVEAEMVEKILGYAFVERRYLAEALTHGSVYKPFKPVATYERLEFVGDAILGLLVAREFFTAYPELPPGPLTRLRGANVDTEKLARIAVAHGLHRYLRHKAPDFESQIQDFMDSITDYPLHSHGLLDPPKVLADIVESLFGAIFIDSNSSLETVWKIFKRLADPLISPETLGSHPVSELVELCHKRGMQMRFNDTWNEDKTFEVFVDDHLVGSATYGHKKDIAQTRAAKAALNKLKEDLPLPLPDASN